MDTASHRQTEGEKRVASLLQALPLDEFHCYIDPRIDRDSKTSRYPDFLIVWRSRGVIALEVKDWLEIIKGDSKQVHIVKRDGSEKTMENPARTARDYALSLKELFGKSRELLKEHRGSENLYFPCEGIAVLPNFPMSTVSALEVAGLFDENNVLSWDDLVDTQAFLRALNRLRWTFDLRVPLNDDQLDAIEYALAQTRIDPVPNVIANGVTPIVSKQREERRGDLTEEQENIVLSPFPPKRTGVYVHLVRGTVGSGKTLVLAKRARRLAKMRPDWKILVTSFHLDITGDLRNRISDERISVKAIYAVCETILGEKYPKAEEYRGSFGPRAIRNWTRTEEAFISGVELTLPLVEAEIARRKDARLEDTYEYLDDLRSRHRGFTTDQQDALCFLHDLYREYQERLKNGGQEWADWEDVQKLTLDALHGHKLQRSYDAIFIDEAQDFSPQMMEIVKRLIRPGGYLFMCDDPVQCLWREFNWREKHIYPDKEETLSYPLRTTQAIMNLAQGLLDSEPKMKSEHDWNTYPAPAHINVDLGDAPTLIGCVEIHEEYRAVEQIVRAALSGIDDLNGIAILCPTSHQTAAWSKLEWVNETKTYVSHFNRIKGLEFDIIIIPHLGTLLNNRQSIDQNRIVLPLRKLFVAVTRARRQLHITYTGSLPSQLQILERYAVIHG